MNKLFKYSLALMVGAFVFASCSDDDDNYQQGTWDAADGYSNLYFETASEAIELDPTEATVYTAQVSRRNTANAATVKFDVTTNTDNVFTISDAVFAAGDSIADILISFPNAETGKPYTLGITCSDPNMVSPKYSKGVTYSLKVTRVKWNDVGYYIDDNGAKVEGWAMYTDIVCGSWFGGSNLTFPTRLQERDDKPGYFRLINTYDYHYPYNDPETAIGAEWQGSGVTREDCFDYSKDYIIYIDATNPKKVYMPSQSELGTDWGYGVFSIWDIAGLRLSQGRPADAEDYYGTYENGAITFPVGAILRSMKDYNDNGLYTASGGQFKLVIDPSKDLYTASLENGDFGWEKVFAGTFMSAQLGKNKPQVALYKGVAKAEIEAENPGCYDRYAEIYGTPYLIAGPYAQGYNIVFCVKDGKVIVPKGFESQALGFTGVGYDIYGAISAAGSSFTDDRIDLAITFQDKSGKVNMGSNTESLVNITFTMDMVTGPFTYYATLDGETVNYGNFTSVADPLAENALVLKDLYLEGSEVAAVADLDAGKIFVGSLEYLGIEKAEDGTPYYIFTYSTGEDERGAAFDINIDGTLTSNEMILAASPDLDNLYYWAKTSETIFVPVTDGAAKRASAFKGSKKGAKMNASAKQLAKIRSQIR